MKVLLLSDIPPCDNFTAGLVLSAMVRFLPRDSVCCFIVANPMLDFRITPEFANIPMRFDRKPNENWSWLPQGRLIRKVSALVARAGAAFTEKTAVRSLIDNAVAYGREQKVDRVWVVLQGQTTILMASAVAERLGVPLHTQVWDPFSWWAKANCLDGVTTRRIQATFDKAIAGSAHVATASQPMAELYRQRFNVDATPVISSHPKAMAQTPATDKGVASAPTIGMAGQFYAAAEWLQLLHALRSANWTVAGRPVKMVVMGPQPPPGAADPHVSFLGWKSQEDAASILSRCDILYCPYPFDASMAEVSKYSFPSKLVLYLAAGRPIVLHGPGDSSPARYIRAKQCGAIADRLVASAVFNELERLTLDPRRYAEIARNAQSAFRADFTLESMERGFNSFIGADAMPHEEDARTYDHAGAEGEPFLPPRLSSGQRHRSVARLGRRSSKVLLAVKRRLWPVVRYIALKVPVLRSLHHEIRGLYAEKEKLDGSVRSLEQENAHLSVLLNGETIDAAQRIPTTDSNGAAAIEPEGTQAALDSSLRTTTHDAPREMLNAINDLVIETDIALDLGCGIVPMNYFRPKLHIMVEPWHEYAAILAHRHTSDKSVLVLNTTAWIALRQLPDNSVDSIFLLDVIEHLQKEDGRRLIGEMERVARRQIVVFTPLGFMPQHVEDGRPDAWGLSGAKMQEHKSGWTPDDFSDPWTFQVCETYHRTDISGDALEKIYGAFFAIRTFSNKPAADPKTLSDIRRPLPSELELEKVRSELTSARAELELAKSGQLRRASIKANTIGRP